MKVPARWRQRALLYRVVGGLPGGDRVFEQLRYRFGGLRDFDLARRDYVLQEMPRLLRLAGKTVAGKDLMEIGAGWHPVVPLLFHGLGATSIVMTDVAAHMTGDNVVKSLDYCRRHVGQIARWADASEAQLCDRWESLAAGSPTSWRAAWEACGIRYVAPVDMTSTAWPDKSVDVIYSNSCLGYIPRPALQQLFAESARLLRPGGWIAHDISVYDDYAGVDPTITPINFLRYSETEWARIGNSRLHFQNRCRPADYVRLAEYSGLRVLCAERLPLAFPASGFSRSDLAPAFRELPAEELLCRHLLLAAEKRA